MTPVLRVSSWIYRALLPAYPSDLRYDFGDEMTDAFVEDLATAAQSRGPWGVIAIWWWALYEVVMVAIPASVLSTK